MAKIVGYIWCVVALAITLISDWAVITEMNTVFGYSPFNVKDSYALAWLLFPGAAILLMSYFLEKRLGVGYSKKSALKEYAVKLSLLLAKRYGKSKRYTREQIERTIIECKCNSSYIVYAYAAFLSQDEFQAIYQGTDNYNSYDDLRREFANSFFHGDTTFDGMALADISSSCEGGYGDGSSCDGGGRWGW